MIQIWNYIKFPTSADSAFWVRTIADLTTVSPIATRTASTGNITNESFLNGTTSTTNSSKNSSGASSRKGSTKWVIEPQVQVYKDKGTGNTVDELSAMYGL